MRIAVRKLGSFERTIEKQWAAFCERESHQIEKTAASDLRLEIIPFDIPDLRAALFDREGLKRGDFDMAFVVTDWIAEAVAGQHLVDLQSFLKTSPPENYPAGWDKSLLRFQTYENEMYGLPFHTGHKCLIYRKDLFEDQKEQEDYEERFDHPLRVPQTWAEFTQVARFFNRPSDGMSGVVFVASQDGYNTICDFWIYVWSRGGGLFDGNERIRLDQPLVEETLDFYRRTVNDSTVMNVKTRTLDALESRTVLAKGEAAMMWNWFSCAAECETMAESNVKGRVGLAPFPKESRPHGFSLNVYWILGVASGSQSKELAYRFIKHCASEAMDRLLTHEGGNGSRLSTWQDDQLNQEIPFYHELASLQKEAGDMPRHPKWHRLGTIIDDMMNQAISTKRSISDITREGQQRAEEISKVSP